MCKEIGFLDPVQQGYSAKSLDFNKILVPNPPSTFVMRMKSAALTYKGIFPDAYLIVDRSKTPISGNLIVFAQNGDLQCREYLCRGTRKAFVNEKGEETELASHTVIYGVVTRELRYL
jgi:DNA polymerase V